MRGAFDDEDEKVERQRPLRDTELTLGTGTLLLLFLGLALVCGAFFGLGYEVGRGVGQPATSQLAAAGGQAGLQTNGAKAKPSATAPPVVPAPAPMAAPPVNASQPAASDPVVASQTGTNASQQQVRSALPGSNTPLPSSDSGMHAVLPPPVQLMVQIAAVSHQEDADVLSTALRKRGYAVVEKREPADGLIHVRMGPFNSRDEANRWRQKLLDDGYNAMIQ
jgi:cell division septation protein DedD